MSLSLETIADKLDVDVDDLSGLDDDDLSPLSKKEKKFLATRLAEMENESSSDDDDDDEEEDEDEDGSEEESSEDRARSSSVTGSWVDDGEGSSVIDSSYDDSDGGASSEEEEDYDDVKSPKRDALSKGEAAPVRGRKWSFIRATRDVKKLKELDDPIWHPRSSRKEKVSKSEMKAALNTVVLQKFADLGPKNRVIMFLVDDTKATMRAFKVMSKRLKPKDVVLLATVRPLMKTGKLTQKFSSKALQYQYNLWRNTVLMQRQYATLLLNANVDFCAVVPMYHNPPAVIKKMIQDYSVYGLYIGVHNKEERGKSQVRAKGLKLKRTRFHQHMKGRSGCKVRYVE